MQMRETYYTAALFHEYCTVSTYNINKCHHSCALVLLLWSFIKARYSFVLIMQLKMPLSNKYQDCDSAMVQACMR